MAERVRSQLADRWLPFVADSNALGSVILTPKPNTASKTKHQMSGCDKGMRSGREVRQIERPLGCFAAHLSTCRPSPTLTFGLLYHGLRSFVPTGLRSG